MTCIEINLKHRKKKPPRASDGSTDNIPSVGVYYGQF